MIMTKPIEFVIKKDDNNYKLVLRNIMLNKAKIYWAIPVDEWGNEYIFLGGYINKAFPELVRKATILIIDRALVELFRGFIIESVWISKERNLETLYIFLRKTIENYPKDIFHNEILSEI